MTVIPSRVLALALLILTVSLAVGQFEDEQLGVPTDLEKYKEKDYLLTKFLNSGSAPGKEEKSWMDVGARYYVFRVTWLDHVNNRELMAKAVKEFAAYYDRVVRNNKQIHAAAADYYNKQFIGCLEQVFARKFESNRISSVNAAQMLPILAKGKSEAVANLCVKIVKDPKMHDAIKLYAVRGLREFFSQRIYTELDLLAPNLAQSMKVEIERVQALDGFIGRPLPKSEIKAEADAYRYLRKEAIESLAQAQVPAISGRKKTGQAEAPVVVTLLKVFAKDALEPSPSLAEKCEAALGICNLKYSDKFATMPEYQPAMGIYAVGQALTQFIDGYRADYSKFLPKKEIPVTPLLPWKINSDRFKEGLQNLVANARDDAAAAALAKELQEKSRLFLEDIRGYKQVADAQAVDFRQWVKSKAPAKSSVFKNLKAPAVELD